MLGGITIVAVNRAGAAAGSARAVPALIACLARAVLSREAAAGLGSHGLFCCAVALFVHLVGLLVIVLCFYLSRFVVRLRFTVGLCVPFGAFPFSESLYSCCLSLLFSSALSSLGSFSRVHQPLFFIL